jgi:hypothetical protein
MQGTKRKRHIHAEGAENAEGKNKRILRGDMLPRAEAWRRERRDLLHSGNTDRGAQQLIYALIHVIL